VPQASHDSARCSTITRWGRCLQPAWLPSPTGRCRSHETWAAKGVVPDAGYHEKIVRRQLQPTWDYLSPAEIEATINGRYRGDGRRLDQYVTDEPLMIELHDPYDDQQLDSDDQSC
jgi:hypothetical protein